MNTNLMCSVLSRGAAHPIAPGTFVALFDARFGDVDRRARVLLPTIEGKQGFIVMVDGVDVLVAFEDFALPLDELKALHEDKRDAGGPLLDHRSHVFVNAVRNPDEEGALRVAMAVLQVASVASESAGVSAVLWSPVETLTPAPQFRALVRAGSMAPDDVPLPILARIGAYQGERDGSTPTFGIFGAGFHRYIGRDIEFAPKARPIAEMLESFTGVAVWLMRKGLVFADGDTCGTSATEVIRVRYQDQGRVLKTPMLMFDIEAGDAASRVRSN